MTLTPLAVERPGNDDIWGDLSVVLGGVRKTIRPLPANPSETWLDLLGEKLHVSVAGIAASDDDWSKIVGQFIGMSKVQIELLVAYDRDGRLGGAEWIGENATPKEIWTAFKQVASEAFPPLADAARFPQLLAGLLPQLLATYGSSLSPTGDAADPS